MTRYTMLFTLLLVASSPPVQAQLCGFQGNEVAIEIFQDNRPETLDISSSLSIYTIDGDFVYSQTIVSRPFCDFLWNISDDAETGSDLDCQDEEYEELCQTDAFVITFGGGTWVYSPQQTPAIGTFFRPFEAVGGSHDFGIGYFQETAGIPFPGSPVTQAIAKRGTPISNFDMYYESVFGSSNYAIPYNHDDFCAGGGNCTVPRYFVAPLQDIFNPPPGNVGVDPIDLTFTLGEINDVVIPDTWPAQIWDETNLELQFPAGIGLVLNQSLSADGVIFTEDVDSQGTGTGWDGIFVGSSGRVFLDGVIVEHAEVGITIRSNNTNSIRNTLFDQNGVGIMADHASGGFAPEGSRFAPGRSRFDLFDSCVTNSEFVDDVTEGHGIWGRWTNARIVDSTVEGNDGYGAFFEQADLQVAHGLLVTGNGSVSSSFQDGLHAGVNGDITLASPLGGFSFFVGPDRNSIHDNDQNQISIEINGFATVGAACSPTCPIGNSVYGAFANPTPKLIRNEPVGIEITAERVFWNTSPADPPDLAFFRPSDVSDKGALSSDPASDAGRAAGCDREDFLIGGSSSARTSSSPNFLTADGEQSRGMDGQTRAWLRERIQAMRAALALDPAADTAEALLGRLYGLQRLDREDELREHAATMGVLSSVRSHLLGGQPIPAALRATAEAALVAGVHDLMRRELYDQATQIVRLFAPQVEQERTALALAITDASFDELDRDYASAIVKYNAIIEGLGPGHEQLAQDLTATIALLQRRSGHESERMGTGDFRFVAAETESRSASGIELGTAYPNPFNPQTVVPFTLDAPAVVSIAVYDVLGRQVAMLMEGRVEAGRHEAILDGSALPSGAYLVRMTARPENEHAARTFTQRITLLK